MLCSAPWEASSKPPDERFRDAMRAVADTGATGLIFAQPNGNLPENLVNFRCTSMACVLVDFEIAHRIASYEKMER